MKKMSKDEHAKQMEKVRAVHRRSAWERVLNKIAYYEAWDRAVTEGVKIGSHEPDGPALSQRERDQLKYLRELRDVIREEMFEHGQLTSDLQRVCLFIDYFEAFGDLLSEDDSKHLEKFRSRRDKLEKSSVC